MAFDGTSVWISNQSGSSVTKVTLNLKNGSASVLTYPVGSSPRDVAFDGANIWVTNFCKF